jgi:hypothetical protein
MATPTNIEADIRKLLRWLVALIQEVWLRGYNFILPMILIGAVQMIHLAFLALRY